MRKTKLIVFLIVLVLLLSGVGFVYFFCKLENVEVKGAAHYTDAQIKDEVITSALDEFAPLLYIKGKLKTIDIPFVEKIEIELIDKNSVRIEVYEKTIVACVEKMGQFFYFDNDGVVVETYTEQNDMHPLIKGLSFDSTVIGEELGIERKSLFGEIRDMAMLIKKNKLKVSTIEYSPDYEIKLYIDDDVINLGSNKNFELIFNNLPGILKAANDSSLVIDMREYSRDNMEVYAKPGGN
ncbi:MAG: cell division protein FtsQ/DivIB [Lachnospiraceae bacterium]|nr:cell division protein FtsQ/DivIB [Lachnospiraceae bacterium]